MAKESGLGHALYVAGNDLSGDYTAIGNIGGGPAPLTITGIDKSAYERIGGKLDGRLEATSWWNPTLSHPVLSALPTGDVHEMYCCGTAIGRPAAAIVGKQVNYDGQRGDDGSFTFQTSCQNNAYPLEWGVLLTAGKRTDTGATNGASLDLTTVSTAFGAQAYLQVFSFAGADVTIKIQDSADNSTFADVTGLTFTAVTTAPGTQRVATASNATIRRYVRAVTTTSGGFTSAQFAVSFIRNPVAVSF
ncbi:hypothetical protein [Streptomyces sp. NK08204]|uniref:hypothetical protein n=1 Tax=Streptomyces sp. NK08204 TaxID=2873260 RepID=UPI001CED3617|nr:hypothetical protein [Streptomyces sp. NK08204]